MNTKEYELKDGSKLQFKLPSQKDKYNVDDFNDNTTNTVTALNDGISRLRTHNTDSAAHSDIRTKIDSDISTHNSSGEAHKNIQKNMSDLATEKANAALMAAKEYADIKAQSAQSSLESHNTNTTAHSDIRDNIALLQKYPCYEYSTSGGAVQRFDDVSVIPHTIGVTVHGATDESGNSVTNPTVSVYGKNMHVFNYKNIRGYTFSGSNCKIVNPTQFYESATNPSLMLPAGTYTFSCRVTGSREYASKSNFSAFFYIGENKTNIEMNNFVSGTGTFKKTFTVTEPTEFRFNNVWFIETPTSADLSLDFQLEVSSTATDYEPYIEPQTVTVPMSFADGEVCEIGVLNAVSPTMTVIATDDNSLVSTVDVKYNRDVEDKIEADILEHNASSDAHSSKFTEINNQLSQKAPLAALSSAIDTHNTSTDAHGALFGSINTQLQGINGGLELLNESVFGDKKYISLPVVDETYKVNKNGTILTTGRSKSYIVRDYVGQTVKAKGWYGGVIPLAVFFDKNGSFLSYAYGDKQWSNTYQDIVIPENAYKVYINDNDAKYDIDLQVFKRDTDYNVRDELERIESLIPDTSAYYDIEQAQLQLAKTQRMNDFVYSDFDKAYFVLTIDDANKFLPLVYNLCHELGVVVCPAIITSNLNTVYDTADGKTIKEICDLIVADGGEILSHSGKFIKADSTKQDYIDVFRTPKQTLESLGYTVRGIITAGGTNYLSNDIRLDNWSRKYYDYSDQNGLGTSKAYYKPRWWFHDLSMDNAKAYIDNAVTNKSFNVMAMHGSNTTTDLEHIDNLRILLEYMISKGTDKLQITTWANVYDNFGTTKLEKRIKALENT